MVVECAYASLSGDTHAYVFEFTTCTLYATMLGKYWCEKEIEFLSKQCCSAHSQFRPYP